MSLFVPIGASLATLLLGHRLLADARRQRPGPAARPVASRPIQTEPDFDFINVLLSSMPGVPATHEPSRAYFIRHLNAFMRVPLEGRAGLSVSTEVRLRVAVSAARILTGLGDGGALRAISGIVLYPHSLDLGDRLAGGRTSPQENGRVRVEAGYWQVLQSAREPSDGYDVLLHEFAHVLDGSDGTFDGIPRRWLSDVPAFERALDHAAARLLLDGDLSEMPLRPRAAVSRAELFAVATEAYFECPARLREHMPPLFDALRSLYGASPASV